MCYMCIQEIHAHRRHSRVRQDLTSLLDDVRKGREVVITDREPPDRADRTDRTA